LEKTRVGAQRGGGIIHERNLAKFGYRSERKVENYNHPAIFWQLARTYELSKYGQKKILN